MAVVTMQNGREWTTVLRADQVRALPASRGMVMLPLRSGCEVHVSEGQVHRVRDEQDAQAPPGGRRRA